MVITINPNKNRFRAGTGIADIYLLLGIASPLGGGQSLAGLGYGL